MFCWELMVTWGLTHEQFCAQPISVVYRLYQVNSIKPFLNSSSWVQMGTLTAATYNVHMGKKSKAMAYDDIYPFLKTEYKEDIKAGLDEESQIDIQRKLNSMFM